MSLQGGVKKWLSGFDSQEPVGLDDGKTVSESVWPAQGSCLKTAAQLPLMLFCGGRVSHLGLWQVMALASASPPLAHPAQASAGQE